MIKTNIISLNNKYFSYNNLDNIDFKEYFDIFIINLFETESTKNKNGILDAIENEYRVDTSVLNIYKNKHYILIKKLIRDYQNKYQQTVPVEFFLNSSNFNIWNYIYGEIYNLNQLLIITNYFDTVVNYQSHAHNNHFKNKHSDCLLTFNPEFNDETRNNFIKAIQNSMNYIKMVYGNYTGSNLTDINIDKTYDNIFIHLQSYKNHYYPYLNFHGTIPVFLYSISHGLKKLNHNGNMFVGIKITFITPLIEKILNLFANSFERYNFVFDSSYSNFDILIRLYKYKKNIDESLLNDFFKISIKNINLNYSTEQLLLNKVYNDILDTNEKDKTEGKDGTNKKNKKKGISFLNFNKTILDKFKNDSFNGKFIYDIKLDDYQISIDGLNMVTEFKHIINNHVNQLYFTTIKFKNDRQEYVNDTLKLYLYNLLLFFTSNKIPFNKSYLSYIDQYNKNLFNQLYGFHNNIYENLLKYDTFKSVSLASIKPQKQYRFTELDEMYTLLDLSLQINHNILNNLNNSGGGFSRGSKVPKFIKAITDNYARGVSTYINQYSKKSLKHTVSNAYCKLWEIFESVSGLMPNHKNIKVFLIAEAPGQWIHTITDYIKKRREHVKDFDWRANSLNPRHPINIKLFGEDIVKDTYGLIKNFPDKWLWGDTGTGDIMNIDNLKWYHKYSQNWGKIDLITGDAGLQSDDPMIYQKLELAQVLMVASVSSVGSNCVIKHFLPYVPYLPVTWEASGFFVNYIYLYYLMFEKVIMIKPMTSNPVSGEFYLVGKKFVGMSEESYNNLIQLIDNFEVNFCFFKQEQIPNNFKKQVFYFIERVNQLNIDHIEIQNTLLTCLTEHDEVIEKQTQCRNFFDDNYVNDFQKHKFTEWIKKYNFAVK
jgi:hypothetical protein